MSLKATNVHEKLNAIQTVHVFKIRGNFFFMKILIMQNTHNYNKFSFITQFTQMFLELKIVGMIQMRPKYDSKVEKNVLQQKLSFFGI